MLALYHLKTFSIAYLRIPLTLSAPRKTVSAIILSFLVLALSGSPLQAATPFVNETVDDVGFVGEYTSLALDARGRPHISYRDHTNGDLKYAVKWNGNWIIETADSLEDVGRYTSIALDADGIPHISYTRYRTFPSTDNKLKYATKVNGVWAVEFIDAGSNAGQFSSIVIDAQGFPRIAYRDVGNNALKFAWKTGAGWGFEMVDGSVTNVGGHCSLALDNSGNPHISYNDDTNDNLKYALKVGGVWYRYTVDSQFLSGVYTSIALDSKDIPHISYQDGSTDDLMYAERTSGTWILSTVDSAGDVGWYTSIEIDAGGRPHISYYDYTNDMLKYAVLTGGSWQIETVDANGQPGRYSSLALDRNGNPCISYYSSTNYALKYSDSAVHLLSPVGGECWTPGSTQTVSWVGAGNIDILLSGDGGASYVTLASEVSGGAAEVGVPTWTTDTARIKIVRQTPYSTSESTYLFRIGPEAVLPWWSASVDSSGETGLYSSIALSADGNPHIGYYDSDNAHLMYAVSSGRSWILETADASVLVGMYASLALGANGEPHMSYLDSFNGDLKYAVRSSGSWSTSTVDATGNTGWYADIALDPLGEPAISYYDAQNQALRFARQSGGSWSLATVDAAGDVGKYTSLAFDQYGDPHISYFDETNDDLKYATNSGGGWTIETVESAGNVGTWTSIAIDTDGNPHISYFDEGKLDLRYASKSAGTWTITWVDTAGVVGRYSSLALDGNDTPHISYLKNFFTGDLRYATLKSGAWSIETADSAGITGLYTSIALDAQGLPHISYQRGNSGGLKYTTPAVEVGDPSPGTVWPVGSTRKVTWRGDGYVSLSLSVDGGSSYDPLAANVSGGEHSLVVPHIPSSFCRVKVERTEEANTSFTYYFPASVSVSDSFFTIETSITLLGLTVTRPEELPGNLISWSTDPGPEDLDGFRLDKWDPSGIWAPLLSWTKETSCHDPTGVPGDRYRLYAKNGLGEEFLLGEGVSDVLLAPGSSLAAWPLPYSSGTLHILFATASGLGGAPAQAEVAIYDVGGRRIRTIVRNLFGPGVQRTTWDGRNDRGRPVSAGIYFLKSISGGNERALKIVVVR